FICGKCILKFNHVYRIQLHAPIILQEKIGDVKGIPTKIYYLTKLDIPFSDTETNLILNEKLIDYKNSDIFMHSWSNTEFGFFLWDKIGRPAKATEIPSEIIYDDIELPGLRNVKPKVIIHTPVTIVTQNEQIQQPDQKKNYKPDYLKQAKRNTLVGKRGEDIVMLKEKAMLINIGRKDLADKVEQVSLKSDSEGYDIMSYTPEGEEKYIEVKATTKPFTNTPFFFISNTEYQKGCELKEKYHIYWVFEAASEEPKILDIPNPFNLPPEKISVKPRSYNISFQFE
ncbi:MAG: DUF3883 domain-containing protein, partial [Candidatus Levyibacteriota bacterium]